MKRSAICLTARASRDGRNWTAWFANSHFGTLLALIRKRLRCDSCTCGRQQQAPCPAAQVAPARSAQSQRLIVNACLVPSHSQRLAASARKSSLAPIRARQTARGGFRQKAL